MEAKDALEGMTSDNQQTVRNESAACFLKKIRKKRKKKRKKRARDDEDRGEDV